MKKGQILAHRHLQIFFGGGFGFHHIFPAQIPMGSVVLKRSCSTKKKTPPEVFGQRDTPRIYSPPNIQRMGYTKKCLAILLVTFSGWLSDPFEWLSDLQLGDEKVTKNHLVRVFFLKVTLRLQMWLLFFWGVSMFNLRGVISKRDFLFEVSLLHFAGNFYHCNHLSNLQNILLRTNISPEKALLKMTSSSQGGICQSPGG